MTGIGVVDATRAVGVVGVLRWRGATRAGAQGEADDERPVHSVPLKETAFGECVRRAHVIRTTQKKKLTPIEAVGKPTRMVSETLSLKWYRAPA